MKHNGVFTKKGILTWRIRAFVLCLMIVLGLSMLAGCGGSNGEFYTLQEAYVHGWLSVEELQSIAYYYQGSEDGAFVPIALNPEKLSVETEQRIKRTHLQNIKRDYPSADISGIDIEEYFGTYGDCIVVNVRDNYRKIDFLVVPKIEIGGVIFYDFTTPGLMVWRENNV